MLVNTIYFKVKGITFENENNEDIQKVIKKILKEYKNNDYFDELYGGYTNNEIIDRDLNVSEYEGYTFPAKLVGDVYNGEECFKIYMKSYNGEYMHIGYAPKKEVKNIADWILKDRIRVEGELEITGGKYKHLEIYEEDYEEKEKVKIEELTYGAKIILYFFNEIIDKEQNKEKKENSKSKKIILFLCCLGFFGAGGMHDFYLKKYCKGLIKFFTINFFMLGTIYDIIKISSGKYKD